MKDHGACNFYLKAHGIKTNKCRLNKRNARFTQIYHRPKRFQEIVGLKEYIVQLEIRQNLRSSTRIL